MSSVASTLLDFILNLLRDPETAEAFARDPQGTLEDHGLGDITSVDIEDIMPVLMDASPSSFDRAYETGGQLAHGLAVVRGRRRLGRRRRWQR